MNIPSELIAQLRAASHIAVFTGAGVSAESGIPTFRDAQTGIWANHSAAELSTRIAFRADPHRVWDWYQWFRGVMQKARPNAAHLALAALENMVEHVTVITQNIDGLHAAAGSTEVLELHGNIWGNVCFACRRPGPATDDPKANGPPKCLHCRGRMRPDVVWFGELLSQKLFDHATRMAKTADVMLVIGTSSLVEPAASLPRLARAAGRIVVNINPEATAHDAIAHHVLRGAAAVVVPALFAAAWPDRAA